MSECRGPPRFPVLSRTKRQRMAMSILETHAPDEFVLEHPPETGDGGFHPELCRDELLHEIFEEQAARTPGHTAVFDGGRQTTYGELDRRSPALAQELPPLHDGRRRF